MKSLFNLAGMLVCRLMLSKAIVEDSETVRSKNMPYYETVYMARQDLSESQVKDLTDRFSKVITDQGGKILKTENWGLRTLAYRINKSRKAHYVLIESDASGDAIIELERIMRLDEDVMRSLTVRLDEPSKGPSPVLEKSRRDTDHDSSSEKEAA